MTLQRIPWAVNGPDVAHSATLARQANFAALGGQTGIVGPESLAVTAGPTPGPFVNVGPGPGVLTYAQGRQGRQNIAYVQAKDQLVPVRNDALERVDIAPTTSAGGRTDLVCIVINDPEFEGTSDTVDYSVHDFVRFHVVRNVTNSTWYPHQLGSLGRPVLPLAQVRIPASTATITDEMIYDARHVAVSRYQTTPLVHDIIGQGTEIIPYTQTSWRTVVSFSGIAVPDWATRAHIEMDLGPMYNRNGRANGEFRVLGRGQNANIGTMPVRFVLDSGVTERFTVGTVGTQNVSWRTAGATVQLDLQVRRIGGANRPGDVIYGGTTVGTFAKGSLTYAEHPIFSAEDGL